MCAPPPKHFGGIPHVDMPGRPVAPGRSESSPELSSREPAMQVPNVSGRGRSRPTERCWIAYLNAHATISGSSSRQNASPCDPTRSVITTSAPAAPSACAQRVAFS